MRRIFAMCLALTMIFITAVVSIAGLNDGLVAYYPFNGNANDESGNGNNGTVHGATLTTDRFGNINSDYNFDGVNNYIRVEDSTSLRPTSITLAGWFYFNSVPSRVISLIEKAIGSGIYDSYVIWYNSGQLHGHIADNSGDGTFLNYSFIPALETWYHIAYTFNGSTHSQSLYVNGKQVDSGNQSKSIAYDSHPVIIGGDTENETLSFFFHGKIDDIRIYNRALSDSEVQELYNKDSGICVYTQAQLDQKVTDAVKAEQLKWDANGDGKIGLEDVIRMLQVIAGLRP